MGELLTLIDRIRCVATVLANHCRVVLLVSALSIIAFISPCHCARRLPLSTRSPTWNRSPTHSFQGCLTELFNVLKNVYFLDVMRFEWQIFSKFPRIASDFTGNGGQISLDSSFFSENEIFVDTGSTDTLFLGALKITTAFQVFRIF